MAETIRILKFRECLHPDGAFWVVEGRLAGDSSGELEREYSSLPHHTRARLCINLERVTFVDQDGIKLLARMEQESVYLEGANPGIRRLLHKRAAVSGECVSFRRQAPNGQ